MPARPTKKALRRKLSAAYRRLLRQYAKTGGWLYPGRPGPRDPKAYLGPTFWSEADGAFRMALELEREFPKQVHMEVALNSSTVHDFDRKRGDVPQMIDIVVSDLSEFEDPDSDPRIAHHVHEAFIEAKHFRKGWWPVSAARALDSVQRDVDRLAEHINRGHCRVAAVLILDDERFFTDRGSGIKWPHSVERYLLNESRARRA